MDTYNVLLINHVIYKGHSKVIKQITSCKLTRIIIG